jgi:hypothetical protein
MPARSAVRVFGHGLIDVASCVLPAARLPHGSPPHRLCGEPLLHIAPYGPWQFESVRNAASGLRGRALFVRGMMHPYFSVGPSRQRDAQVWLPRFFWSLMAHPLLGEEDSTSQPRWL